MDWTYYILWPNPAAGLMVVLILVIIEGVLSVDNAAVLATMVMRPPEEQRGRALSYGIIGAYAFLSAKSQVLASAGSAIHGVLASHYFDMGTSALTLLIFIVPVAVHRLKHGKCAS